jgi:hypothetical protein
MLEERAKICDMGKTFRREKSYKPRGGKLHTHRDLPDLDLGEAEDYDQEEDSYGKKLRPEKRDNKPVEDPKTPQND